MTGKKLTLAVATALAACFVGCEWSSSSESDSWSSAYDAMNFSGTYRAVTTATEMEEESSTNTSTNDTIRSVSESRGEFAAGSTIAAGGTKHGNIVPKSFQVVAGNNEYVWNDDGEGHLLFTSTTSGTPSDEGTYEPTKAPTYTATWGGDGNQRNKTITLPNSNISGVSVTVGKISFTDGGDGKLSTSSIQDNGSSYVSTTGTIVINLKSSQPKDTKITVDYMYTPTKGNSGEKKTTNTTGSGTIQYPSGAWSVHISPAMAEKKNLTVRYSYTVENSTTKEEVQTTLRTTTDVTALTVSQNGQNLTITLNNGVVMSGKFTNAQQTGKVNQDTNAGYNTYNAQFQVQGDGTRFVGSLNYDLKNGYRMLNGTWTWGKDSYDVQAVGPAWLNSADASTLSPGVLTK